MANIIELVEEICDFPLTDFHKEIVAQERGLLNKEFADNYSVEKTFQEPFPYAVEKKE